MKTKDKTNNKHNNETDDIDPEYEDVWIKNLGIPGCITVTIPEPLPIDDAPKKKNKIAVWFLTFILLVGNMAWADGRDIILFNRVEPEVSTTKRVNKQEEQQQKDIWPKKHKSDIKVHYIYGFGEIMEMTSPNGSKMITIYDRRDGGGNPQVIFVPAK